MLKTKLIHPQMLAALGRAGHGSKVLIADGNYPASTRLAPRATLINLNLMPGIVTCTQVLEALVSAVPIEHAAVMQPLTQGPYAMAGKPEIWAQFSRILAGAGFDEALEPIERFRFYEVASQSSVALTVATGEQRIYANLLLTIGVVMTEDTKARRHEGTQDLEASA